MKRDEVTRILSWTAVFAAGVIISQVSRDLYHGVALCLLAYIALKLTD